MKITIGVTTYNRLDLLHLMVQSFYASERPYSYNLRIYDDASEYVSEESLRQMFPDAVTIFRQMVNRGADLNTKDMYEDFLKSGDDVFFNADSDLIFSHDWMEKGIYFLEKTEGILSIFNAASHPAIFENEGLCEKKHLGAAGTFFIRERLMEFISNKCDEDEPMGIDWSWSRYFQTRGVKLFSTTQSFVQHIGLEGFNSQLGLFDFGKNFFVDSQLNGQILNDVIEKYLGKEGERRKEYVLFPFSMIDRDEKVVLYGYGDVGRDFEKQIRKSGYCNLVAIVDKSFQTMHNVQAPEELLYLDFDKIVLAVLREETAESMKAEIKRLSATLLSKVCYSTWPLIHFQ